MRPALALAMLAATAAIASAAPPVFRIEPDTLHADTLGMWRASLVLENHDQWGLYPDSLFLDWKCLDDDASTFPTSGTMTLSALARAIEPAGADEQTGLDWSAPANFERGSVTFRLYAHDAKKVSHALSVTLAVTGNALYDLHPPVLLDVGSRKVEVVHMSVDASVQPGSGVLYVPPAGVSARSMMRWASQLVWRGHAVSIVSLPGSGHSTGAADRAGPASVGAVEAALDRLAHEPDVDRARLAIWGLGEGATAALLVAEKHPDLRGVVAQNAVHDPWSAYRALGSDAREAFAREAGRDSASWRARSPLAAAAHIAAPVLVLQTEDAPAPETAAAREFAAIRSEKGLPVESRMNEPSGRAFQRQEAVRLAIDYLARRLKRP